MTLPGRRLLFAIKNTNPINFMTLLASPHSDEICAISVLLLLKNSIWPMLGKINNIRLYTIQEHYVYFYKLTLFEF